ncbi:MAG TPA: HAD-IB family hydrolase [Solirubrobacteraceae bacterium]|jgi:HAD superfamily hydrolase (TIGR01490 family)|nr:HAD-IB family hydrolase [Solirubrobacteraceae bacterium]
MTIAAFFDFDGTLIEGYSALAFLADRASRSDLPLQEALELVRGAIARDDFERFMRRSCQAFRGQDSGALVELGERLYRERLADVVFPEAAAIVAEHRTEGHTVIIASSALPFQVEPAARELGFDHVLCSRLEIRDGVCTGRVEGPVLWGPGKAQAVRGFAQAHGVDLEASFAYGNGDEDIDFLRTVGQPNPVNPKPELGRLAREQGWPVHRFTLASRPGTATRLARLVRDAGRETLKALAPD